MQRRQNKITENKFSTYNLFKFMCKVIRFTCFEDFWYKTEASGRHLLLGYVLVSAYMFMGYGNESLEVIFNTYPKDLHREAILYIIAQGIMIFRVYYYSYRRIEVKELIIEMVEVCGEYEIEHIQRNQYKKLRYCLMFHLAIVYCLQIFIFISGFKRYVYEGQPLVFVPGIWPKFEDMTTSGIVFKSAMFIFIVILAALIFAKDSLVILKLIVISYKFTTLCCYFENLRKDFDNNEITIVELKYKYLKGIVMHRELLRITRKFRHLYDVVLSIHVSQGVSLVVIVMIKIAFTPEFTNIIQSLLYMCAVIGQLCLFMWNAGEITYQASLLPTSMFHCGWHLRPVNCEHSRAIRSLVLMGCLQAQIPLVLKAFGIQDVSYGSFLSVIQTSYSIFAVFRTAK